MTKKRPAPTPRPCLLGVRVTIKERERIERDAEAAGLALADYLRGVLLPNPEQRKSRTYGQSVRERRIARNLSQHALARMAGTKQPYIARVEAGEINPG